MASGQSKDSKAPARRFPEAELPPEFARLLPGHSQKVIEIHWNGRDGQVWRAARKALFQTIHELSYEEKTAEMVIFRIGELYGKETK